METFKLASERDGLELEVALICPAGAPKAIVQFSHGMAEHKERYFPFMNFLAKHGYLTVIHDHRGHGASVKDKSDLGYFYTERPEDIAEDLYQVNREVCGRYPGLPVFLFSHSMGTLVARVFLQTHDDAVEKVVLCGPPTENPLAPVGIALARLNALFFGKRHRSRLLNRLTFGTYGKKGEAENAWICSDAATVDAYAQDALCGYVFTDNGFLNLYRLMRQCFRRSAWQVKYPSLPLFVIAGENDPVIQNRKKFDGLVTFLGEVGYSFVRSRLYPGLRHELLNETGKENIWNDVLGFFEQAFGD